MFESIRKHSRVVMLFLFLLIIPSFVLVGIDSKYFSGGSPVVARVDGHDITQEDWDNTHRIESDRIRAEQPSIDAKLLDSPSARYAMLERMVRERVLQAAAKKMRIITTDAKLASSLQEIPQIAALRRADGTLDAEAYRALVGAQGMTPEGFEARMRNDLAVNQVMGVVMGTSFATPAQANVALDALFQRRDIQLARFEPKNFANQVQPTEADLQAYYQQHPAQFQQAEQVNVDYVVLNLDAVRDGITLNQDDLQTYYKENLARLAGKEERRASHILIAAPKDAPAADRTKAKERATELLEQVRKNPASFAEVAKKSSDDTGSATQGGDLGFFGPGAMVKPFEEAAFALQKGGISDVVESDFGYHIITLTDVKTPRQPSFEELRASLEADLKQQQAQRKYAEVAEAFTNDVYEQSDSLQPVADKLKLKLQTAQNVARTPAVGATGPLANEKFLQAIFSADSLEHKRNTEAIEIGTNQMVAGRVTQYAPARTLAFDEVQAQVKQLYIEEKSAELARKEGEAKLAAWTAQPGSATGLAAPMLISRDQPQNQPRALIDAVLSAKADTLPAWTGVSLGLQGYVIAKINKVMPGTAPAAEMAQRHQQYQQWLAKAEGLAYYEMLKERFKVQIKVPRPTAAQNTAEN
ncbi:MAG: SurA N-terminal domain-containing protein [Giesbergeria sp.]|nr:SurA N-terminal domain-containing protein [Giesbergeria sp.]MBP6418838.1 SurA N-terminal domain-containing protein [Giesbergeria sp.]